MRKLFWIALVALGASSAPIGAVQAETVVVAEASDLDPVTLERIYGAVSCATGMCVGAVRDAYAEGRMEVEKEADAYRVTVLDGGGDVLVIVILEDF